MFYYHFVDSQVIIPSTIKINHQVTSSFIKQPLVDQGISSMLTKKRAVMYLINCVLNSWELPTFTIDWWWMSPGIPPKNHMIHFWNVLTWPMAKLETFWEYIFSRENKPFNFFYFRVHWLSECQGTIGSTPNSVPWCSLGILGDYNP